MLGNRFPLKMKGKVYRCCDKINNTVLYESEAWCLKKMKKQFKGEHRGILRAMCGQKVVGRKRTEEQMDRLGLKETIDQFATANGVRWYGHVPRRDDDSVLRVALDLEVNGNRKRERPKTALKKQVKEETERIGLKKEVALNRAKWKDGVQVIAGHLC